MGRSLTIFEGDGESPTGIRRPDCVESAGPVALEVWEETLAEMQREGLDIRSLDSRALASYCMAWQRVHDAQEEIARDGITCASKTGALYQHPAVGVENKAQEQIRKLETKLGLSPLDRKRGGHGGAIKKPAGVQQRKA